MIEAVWEKALKPPPDQEWAGVSSPRDLLRQYVVVDLEPPAVQDQRRQLEEAQRLAPEDDRVWLGLALLNLEEGRLDDSANWLRRCLDARPDDPAVHRAQLRLAMARDDASEAREALAHLAEEDLTPDQILTLEAWFAEHRGDLDAARSALVHLLERSPTNLEALERLAGLLVRAGDPESSAELRARKAELDAVMNNYRSRYFKADLAREGPDLAKLAETLGRWFEAEAWWTLIARSRGHDDETRAALFRLRERRQSTADLANIPTLNDLRAQVAKGTLDESDRPHAPLPIRFIDDAEEAGLDFVHEPGRTPEHQLPETMSGGVALLDFDRDGHLDLFAVQGGRLEGRADPSPSSGDRLYRNRGDGTFEDRTDSAGLGRDPRYGLGVSSADYDNDGHPDLLVTRLGSCSLYRNQGDGTFAEVTEDAGLAGVVGWSSSTAFADIDNDGDLDLYLARYVDWDVHNPTLCRREDGTYSYCHPLDLKALPDQLFRNDDGRFVDVSDEAGIVVSNPGRGLGVLAADLDEDGRIDFYVANDATANFFFHNLGDGRFEERAELAGLAANARGATRPAWGSPWATSMATPGPT